MGKPDTSVRKVAKCDRGVYGGNKDIEDTMFI